MPAPQHIMTTAIGTVRIEELHANWVDAERQAFDLAVADAVGRTAAKEPVFLVIALSFVREPGERPINGSLDRDRLRQDALDLCTLMVRKYVLECELPQDANHTYPTSLMIRDLIEQAIDKLGTLFLRARTPATNRHRQTVGPKKFRRRVEARHVPTSEEVFVELATRQSADDLSAVIDAMRYRQLFVRVAQLAEAGALVDPQSRRKMRADRARTVVELAWFLSEAGPDELDLYFSQDGKLMIAPLQRNLASAGRSYDRATVARMWRDVAAAAIQLETPPEDVGPSRFERTD